MFSSHSKLPLLYNFPFPVLFGVGCFLPWPFYRRVACIPRASNFTGGIYDHRYLGWAQKTAVCLFSFFSAHPRWHFFSHSSSSIFNDFLCHSLSFTSSFLISTHIISVKHGCCFQPKMERKHPVKSLCSQRYFQHTHATEWFCPPLEGPEEASPFPRQSDPAGSSMVPWKKPWTWGLRLNPTAIENHICLHSKLEYCMWNWWLCGLLKVGHILNWWEKVSSSIKEANLLEARPTPEKPTGWLNPRPLNVGIKKTYQCSFAEIATCL